MIVRIFLLHGYGGHPESGWLPWLKRELKASGHSVQALSMPDTEAPRMSAWVEHLERKIGTPNEDVLLIGHSLGCPTILRYLEKTGTIGGAVLVAGFYEDLGPRFLEIKHFVDQPMDFELIRSHCKRFAVVHGTDDEVVPLPFATRLAEKLGVTARVTPGRGHYSGDNGILQAEEILQETEKITDHK